MNHSFEPNLFNVLVDPVHKPAWMTCWIRLNWFARPTPTQNPKYLWL